MKETWREGSLAGDRIGEVEQTLEVERLSLYGTSVKETWREGSLAGDRIG